MIDRCINLLFDWLADYLIMWLSDYLINWLFDWLIAGKGEVMLNAFEIAEDAPHMFQLSPYKAPNPSQVQGDNNNNNINSNNFCNYVADKD